MALSHSRGTRKCLRIAHRAGCGEVLLSSERRMPQQIVDKDGILKCMTCKVFIAGVTRMTEMQTCEVCGQMFYGFNKVIKRCERCR